MNWMLYIDGLFIMLALAGATWLLSLVLRDVSIVDSIWSLMFLAASVVYLSGSSDINVRSLLIISLVIIWSLRLSAHLTWRNLGKPEDRRYQAIRKKYSPNFALKSLGIIFVFQAVLAWIISLPLFSALTIPASNIMFDGIALLLWVTGMYFETVADWQLAKFTSNPANKGKVLDSGLWRYSRHPNYFGECLIWWAFYLLALGSGSWWTIVAPLLMTWLLLKFSGVVMLEEKISSRRPAYSDYVKHTNTFVPGPRKVHGKDCHEEHTK